MDRKSFLKKVPVIGATAGFSLVGCNTSTGVDITDLSGDLAILTQAAEREAIAIKTYLTLEDFLETQTVIGTAIYFQSHHQEHLELFNELIASLNGNPIVLDQFSFDSRASQVSDQESAIRLAMTLEIEAAQSYFEDAITNLSSNNAKLLIGSIYPVELSHFVTLNASLGTSSAILGSTLSEIFSDFNRVI